MKISRSLRWPLRLILLLWASHLAFATLPSPESHFGYRMGAEGKLVQWADVMRYFQQLAAASDRIQVSELGRSTEGNPLIMATVADAATLRSLDRYRAMQARLADPRRTTPTQAEALVQDGKVVVLITCSIHSTEVASTHTALEFVYRLLTEDTKRHRAILRNTIFLLIPSLNPDGIDKVAAWYRRYLGTPHEGAPMIELYHKYVGHDNNRDWYIFSQLETRLVIEKAHNAWRPQIVYDVHQMGSQGARMFVPPWVDPIDPNIDPLIVQQVNKMGTAMAADLTAAGKTGVVVNGIYDYFTPARHYQSYHGGLRILSEAASARYATPIHVPFSSLQTKGRGYNAQKASWNFPEPWPGGDWTLRDIVDYQLISFESCLYQAAINREGYLRNFYRIGQRVIRRGGSRAFVVPRSQHDLSATTRLLQTLEFGDVEIEQAQRDFRAGGREFREGDYVIRLAQPYGAFAKTLLERQPYPDLRLYPGGAPRRPYDVTAHTLPLLMGVQAFQVDEPPDVPLARVDTVEPKPGLVASSKVVALSSEDNRSWLGVNRLLQDGVEVYRNENDGVFYIRSSEVTRPKLEELAADLGLHFGATGADPARHRRLRQPRLGLYRGFVPMMDEGWTRWVLEQAEFPYRRIDNERVRAGNLNGEFDVIILPDATPKVLHGGYLLGALYNGVPMPIEYTGGIEQEGAEALRAFVEAGGTLLTLNKASAYALERLRPGVRDVLSGLPNDEFYAPGSLLHVKVDTTHPLCFGMKPEEAVWFESGAAFEAKPNPNGRPSRVVLRYPAREVLASGWLLGEDHIRNRAAVLDVPLGEGHLVLFGIRPQYRGQANATFKMLFNCLYYW